MGTHPIFESDFDCLTVFGRGLSREEASQFLSRSARASNWGGFEESKSGNLERECIEENCTPEEFHEVYDDRALSNSMLEDYINCVAINSIGDSSDIDSLRSCIEQIGQSQKMETSTR